MSWLQKPLVLSWGLPSCCKQFLLFVSKQLLGLLSSVHSAPYYPKTSISPVGCIQNTPSVGWYYLCSTEWCLSHCCRSSLGVDVKLVCFCNRILFKPVWELEASLDLFIFLLALFTSVDNVVMLHYEGKNGKTTHQRPVLLTDWCSTCGYRKHWRSWVRDSGATLPTKCNERKGGSLRIKQLSYS